MKIMVASKNPVKIDAVKEAFSSYFKDLEVIGEGVSSGVSDQPFGWDTFLGAENRAKALHGKADFSVGIEGGVFTRFGKHFTFGAICVMDRTGRLSFGTSPILELPEAVVSGLKEGKELGTVMDELTNEHNSKQKGGAVGFFTKGVVTRKAFYTSGIMVALAPFVREEAYQKGKF